MKTFLTTERSTTASQKPVQIPKGTTLELLGVNTTRLGALIRVKTVNGEVLDLDPRAFNQTQVQPLLREAFSRR